MPKLHSGWLNLAALVNLIKYARYRKLTLEVLEIELLML